MKKIRMTSRDLTARNIETLAELFPNVVTETTDAEGGIQRSVDFDMLRQELSDHVVEGPQERYQLDWPGKRAAAFAANTPIAKTLRPVRDESVDFDTTENLFIEGNNLDALKLLQESYLGKIKLIYIDPPYNTGNDFVYADDFAESTAEYLAKSEQVSDVGERLVANSESNGRFHSDWLSMMYSRLKLARNLLTDDGVIAISIDDHEVSRLRALCDESLGPSAFMGTLVWRRRPTADSRNFSRVSTDHEYVLLYGRSPSSRVKGRSIDESKYRNPDEDIRGSWVSENLTGLADASSRPNLHYDLVNPETGISYPPSPSRGWAKAKATTDFLIADGRILWPASRTGRPREKKFLSDLRSTVTGLSTWISSDEVGYNYAGTREVRDLFGAKVFDFPKSTNLVKFLVDQVTTSDDIVMDFFAGSGSTAQAVIEQNSTDGGARKFVLVQLAEPTEVSSHAFEAGYRTISAISRERIRRAGTRLNATSTSTGVAVDSGFRALRIDSASQSDVLRSAEDTQQLDLAAYEPSIKPDRFGEDLLFQALLDAGLELTLPITREERDGFEIYDVEQGALMMCCRSREKNSLSLSLSLSLSRNRSRACCKAASAHGLPRRGVRA
ncbi:site-specific DNA-methyltransferase [Glutamicibacter arilaitensis]|uniref:site-specific DNA-methyltransferase n=1 Tax=Glutamicibacter arilaitensis TaxID=256701 RepID=UPI003FD1CE93